MHRPDALFHTFGYVVPLRLSNLTIPSLHVEHSYFLATLHHAVFIISVLSLLLWLFILCALILKISLIYCI